MANTMYPPHKSSLNIDANIVMLIVYFGGAVLSYLPVVKYVAFAVPLILFFVEKKSPYVRFHAAQAIVLQIVTAVFAILMGILAGIAAAAGSLFLLGIVGLLTVLASIVAIIVTVLEIICAIRSWKYECYKLPLVGNWADALNAKFPIR